MLVGMAYKVSDYTVVIAYHALIYNFGAETDLGSRVTKNV